MRARYEMARAHPLTRTEIALARRTITCVACCIGLLAALAAVAPWAASADAFCHDSSSPCKEGFLPNTQFATHSKSVSMMNGSSTEESCESTLEGESTADLAEGEGITGKVTSLTFANCTGLCEAVEANRLPYSLLGKANAEGGGGTASFTSGGSGNPRLTWTGCAFGVTCVYETAEEVLNFSGGKGGSEEQDGRLEIKRELSRVSGTLCPAAITWTGTYTETMVGAELSGGWWWSRPKPIISWNSHDYGEVTVNTPVTAKITTTASVELEFGKGVLAGNGEGVFTPVVDNCSNQKILGNCLTEVTCKPKAVATYEATRELSWKKVGGGSEGTLKMRLKCRGK